jgi:hypothetical protein
VATSYFKSHFTVDEKGEMIGKLSDGQVIYSKEKPGQPANFDECLETLINSHPAKDSFMSASNQQGSGNPPNGKENNNSSSSSHDRIKAGIAARQTS